MKQRLTSHTNKNINFRSIKIYMANLLSTLKLFSNITDIPHTHNNKLMYGYASNSLLLPLRAIYIILLSSLCTRPLTTKPNIKHLMYEMN